MTEARECQICTEKFNKSTHASVVCEFGDCNYEACKTCVRKYILGTTNFANCMNCKKLWSQKFIIEKLNKSYMDKEYKEHRKILLTEVEISKIPETIEEAEVYKKNSERAGKRKLIYDEIVKLKLKYRDELEKLNNEINKTYGIETVSHEGERKKFIMPCPGEECRGFLSTQYKCDLCQIFACPDCLEIIGYRKDDEHECKEESVASAELIKKDTRACPSCGTRIYRIEGCPQMFCTNCKTGFNWNSGKIVTGVIHNPHYYMYHRELAQKEGRVINNPVVNVIGVCGNFPNLYHFNRVILKIQDIILKNEAGRFHRCVAHIGDMCVRSIRHKLNDYSHKEKQFRINYILKTITKKQLSDSIFRIDCGRNKYIKFLNIYEILYNIGTERLNSLLNIATDSVDKLENEFIKHIDEYHKLRKYCNEQFLELGKVFNCQIPQVAEDFTISNINKKNKKKEKT